MVKVRLIESYGNILLEIFARKNVSFRVTQPTTLRFSLHYLGGVLLVNQCDLTYILLHNWSIAGGWKREKWYSSCIIFNWWKLVKIISFVAVATSFAAGIIIYLNFDLNKTSVFVQIFGFYLNQIIRLIRTEGKEWCVLSKAFLSHLVVRKSKYWPKWTRKGLANERCVVRQIFTVTLS